MQRQGCLAHLRAAALAATLVCAEVHADAPLSYLSSAGTQGRTILPLTWGMSAISVAVVAIVFVLTVIGIARRRDPEPGAIATPPQQRDASLWLWLGVGISSVVLALSLVWTVRVLAHAALPQRPMLTIEVTGQQWWWKVRYLDDDPTRIVTTANEIHIPVGVPVRVTLAAADVIHSFWVPQLGGKTDAIPGQVNVTWLEAEKPGRYRGQCSEYCGPQHAHMGFEVVAETPQAFERWRAAQLVAAATPPDATEHAHTFEVRCGACHTVRGTRAGGTTGPDLTHLLSRARIAATTLPNTAEARAAWIANPQGPKPGNHMPLLQLSSDELRDIGAYLATLD